MAGLGPPPPAVFLSSYFVPLNTSSSYPLGQRIGWMVHFNLRTLRSSQSFNTELYFLFLFLSFFPSRIYSSLSLSTFHGLLVIISLANFIFFLISHIWIPSLPLSLSNSELTFSICIFLDTFLVFFAFLLFFILFSRYFTSHLVPVFISYLYGFIFPVSYIRVYFLCHCCLCCLYFSVHTERHFHTVSIGAMSIPRILKT